MGRPKRHKYLPKKGRLTHKQAWLQGLLSAGFMFEICILKISSVETLNSDEISLIAHYRSLGYRLTNLTEGGEGTAGYVPTAETRLRMSLAGRGKPKSRAHVKAVADAMRGKHHSEEAKKHISEGRKGRGCRPVKDENGTIYPSIKAAAETLNLWQPHVSMVLSGKLKHAEGHIFSYVTKED